MSVMNASKDPYLDKLRAYVVERPGRSAAELHRDVAPDLGKEAFQAVLQEACTAGIERVGVAYFPPNAISVEDSDVLFARLCGDVDRIERKLDALAARLAKP